MKDSARIRSLTLVAGLIALVFGVGYGVASRLRPAPADDELAWLAHEFGLSAADIARVRPLHEGYRPQCAEMCARIAARNRDLATLLQHTAGGPEVERHLREIAALRAECQARMLRHFEQVAAALPAAQGARYRAEMQRLTLGLQQGMESGVTSPGHEQH